jgi:hypothetical protein
MMFLITGVITADTPSPSSSTTDAHTYYVSSTGDDANDGLTPEKAWKSIERVNHWKYSAGDRILFEGGKTFTGVLAFVAQTVTSAPGKFITISSYGDGRATIGGESGGMIAVGVAGFRIENINFKGKSPTSGGWGICFMNENPTTVSGIRISDVEISGYSYGIYLQTGAIPSAITDIRIERLSTHDNGLGMSFFGHYQQPAALNKNDYAIRDIYVGQSQFYNNTGFNMTNFGAGFTMMNVKNVLIENNVIHDNGGDNLPPGEAPNGPSAITLYDGHNVTIQRNEIYRQRLDPDGPTDNSGIDIWATDSVFQYNYVHDNEGWGMTLGAGDPFQDPSMWPSERLTIRYNIFENNSRRLPDSKIPVEWMGTHLLIFGTPKDFDIYNNTFYSRNSIQSPPENLGIQAMVSIVACPPYFPKGLRFRNNIFIGEDKVPFVEVNFPGCDVLFQNNAYIGGSKIVAISWPGELFDTIAAWSEKTGQEKVDGKFVAKITDFNALESPGKGGTQYPRPLNTLSAYRLKPGSPLIDTGLDLRARFGIKTGIHDFFGKNIPSGQGFDIGAHEVGGEKKDDEKSGCRPLGKRPCSLSTWPRTRSSRRWSRTCGPGRTAVSAWTSRCICQPATAPGSSVWSDT